MGCYPIATVWGAPEWLRGANRRHRTSSCTALICRSGGNHVVRHHWPANAFECKLGDRFDCYDLSDCQQNPRTDEYLAGLGFIAQSRRNIGYGPNCRIIVATLEANRPQCRKAVCDPD